MKIELTHSNIQPCSRMRNEEGVIMEGINLPNSFGDYYETGMLKGLKIRS